MATGVPVSRKIGLNGAFAALQIKAASNLQKHGVSFVEAATIFFDPLSSTVSDPTHSADEQRFAITGMSYQHRLLVVVHADRGDRIRIISARLASVPERNRYESGE